MIGGRRMVFANGCFDLLHPGHIHFLDQARLLGDILIVGVNSDRSVQALKGSGRPIIPQDERVYSISALSCVSVAILFDELTPLHLIKLLRPDVLVKGWDDRAMIGKTEVESWGGKMITIPRFGGWSTSRIVSQLQELKS